ncbi:LPS-assembly protein LptD [bacterium]|nr:LPS-assembly protein LptD [bacterium]
MRRRIFLVLGLSICAGALPLFGEEAPIKAENLAFYEGGDVVIASGQVELSWREWEIEADELVLDYREHLITASGRVLVKKLDHVVVASTMVYNTKTDRFVFENARGYFPGEGEDAFYFKAEIYRGSSNRFILERAKLSSCGPSCNREYEISSRKALVVPKDHIEAWGDVLYLGGVPVGYFPYLYLDLKERKGTVNITVGKNKAEGTFVKSSWYYTVSEQFVGGVLYDWTQKKGTRRGLNNSYWLGALGGLGSLFFTTSNDPDAGQDNQVIQLSQAFRWGGLSGNISANRNRTFLVSGSSLSGSGRRDDDALTTSLNWAQGGGATTSLSGNWRENRTALSSTQTQSWNLNDSRKFGSLNWQSRSTYSFRKSQGGIPGDQDLRYTGTLSGRSEGWLRTWSLKASQTVDTDKDKVLTDESRPFNDEMPSLTLGFSPSLWDNRVGNALWVSRIGLTATRRRFGPPRPTVEDPNPNQNIFESQLQVSQQNAFDWGWATLTPRNAFTQTFYDTGDALFSVQPSMTLNVPHGDRWTTTLSHQYRASHGRNPRSAFNTSSTNSLSWQWGFSDRKGGSFRMTSGYDFRRNAVLDPSLSLTTTPSLHSRATLTWGWSLTNDEPRDLTVRYQLLKRGLMDWSMNMTWEMPDWAFALRSFQSRLTARLPQGFQVGLTAGWRPNDNSAIVDEILISKTNCCTFWQLSWREYDEAIQFTWGVSAFRDQPLGLSNGNEGFLLTQIPGASALEGGIGN